MKLSLLHEFSFRPKNILKKAIRFVGKSILYFVTEALMAVLEAGGHSSQSTSFFSQTYPVQRDEIDQISDTLPPLAASVLQRLHNCVTKKALAAGTGINQTIINNCAREIQSILNSLPPEQQASILDAYRHQFIEKHQ